jgi:hypothetical protein
MAGPTALRIGVPGHHQRPGTERHELPGEQEAVGIVGQQNEIHRCGEQWKQRLDPRRQVLVPVESQAVHRRGQHAAIDHDPEERRHQIEPQPQSDGRQADRQAGAQHFARQQHLQIDGAEDQGGKGSDRIDHAQRATHQRRKASRNGQRR